MFNIFKKFPFIRQHDGMQCGIACLAMICHYYGKGYSLEHLSELCGITTEGVSLKAIAAAAKDLGMDTLTTRATEQQLREIPLPCILHWNQNHFVVLYKIDKNGKRFYICDPGKGRYTINSKELSEHWISTRNQGKQQGITFLILPKENFGKIESTGNESRSFRFLWGYVMKYRRYFLQIIFGLILSCILQLVMPFLTQWVVDIGIVHADINFIWLVLIGELMIVIGRAATDFIRRWLLLHISMRINISLVSDFFIKLLKLPMSFFDTKLMGDLLQRIGDHSRVQNFLTGQVLNIIFTFLSFIIFGISRC